jgi:hypothetical protein
MKAFIAGIVIGVVVSTVGLGGITNMLDNGIETLKNQSRVLAE